MSATMINLTFAFYLISLAAYGVSYIFSRPKWRFAGIGALGVAWILQTVYLLMRWQVAGHSPLSNQYESLVTMSWGVTLLFFGFYRINPAVWFGFWVATANLLILAVCSILDRSIAPLVPALQSNWLLFHVAVIMMGYSGLTLSFVAAIVYLAAYARGPAGSKSTIRREAADALDKFNERAMALGYLLLTIGIILGAVWANEAWGSYWSWDPKETWSLVTWLVYTTALHLRRTRGWKGTRMAWLSIIGFAFVLFTYFGVNYLMSGLHSYTG